MKVNRKSTTAKMSYYTYIINTRNCKKRVFMADSRVWESIKET